MKNLKITYFFMALLAFGIFSCSSDDEPGPDDQNTDPVNIEDDNAVSKALSFENGEATVVEEATFPAQSEDAGAPSLDGENSEDLLAISGGKLELEIDEETGNNLKGAYVQVDGANHYYNIVFDDTNSNGRTAGVQNAESIVLVLPAGLEEGNFCLTYAVYDDQGRVSNSVNICVEVKNQPGEESNFLTANEWAMEMEYYWTEHENGEPYVDTTIVGKVYKDSYLYEYSCPGDSTYKEVTLNEEYILDYVFLTLSADGTFIIEESESGFDDDASNICETGNITRIDEEDIFKSTGSWSYDDGNKELTLIRQSEENLTTGEVYTDTDTEIFQVKFENDKLTLTSDWDDEPNVVIYSKK